MPLFHDRRICTPQSRRTILPRQLRAAERHSTSSRAILLHRVPSVFPSARRLHVQLPTRLLLVSIARYDIPYLICISRPSCERARGLDGGSTSKSRPCVRCETFSSQISSSDTNVSLLWEYGRLVLHLPDDFASCSLRGLPYQPHDAVYAFFSAAKVSNTRLSARRHRCSSTSSRSFQIDCTASSTSLGPCQHLPPPSIASGRHLPLSRAGSALPSHPGRRIRSAAGTTHPHARDHVNVPPYLPLPPRPQLPLDVRLAHPGRKGKARCRAPFAAAKIASVISAGQARVGPRGGMRQDPGLSLPSIPATPSPARVSFNLTPRRDCDRIFVSSRRSLEGALRLLIQERGGIASRVRDFRDEASPPAHISRRALHGGDISDSRSTTASPPDRDILPLSLRLAIEPPPSLSPPPPHHPMNAPPQ